MTVLKINITSIRVVSLVFIIIILANFQYLFTRQFNILPEFVTVFDDLLCLCLIVHTVYSVFLKKVTYNLDTTDVLVLFFLFSALISVMLNSVPILNAVLGLRCFFIYYILYASAKVYKFSINDIKKILDLLFLLVLIHIPFTFIRFLTWNPSLPYSREDSGFGYLFAGTSNILGVLFGIFFFYLFLVKTEIKKQHKIILSILILVAFTITQSKVMYIFMILLTLYYITFYQNRFRFVKIFKNFFIASIILIFTVYVATIVSNDVRSLFSYESIVRIFENQFNPALGSGRLFYLLMTIFKMSGNVVTLLFGFGPGMYSSYAGISLKSKVLQSVLISDIDHRAASLDPDFTAMLGEYGFVGFFLFSLILLSIFLKARRSSRTTKSGFVKKYQLFFSGFVVLFYFGAFVNGLWQAQFFSSYFWVMAGVMHSISRVDYENRY